MTNTAPMTDDGMTDDAPMTDDGMTDDAPMTDDGVDSTGGGATLPFALNLSGYNPHVGADVHVKIFASDDTELGEVMANLDAADQTFTIDNVATDGETYTVRWWVDVMDNDTCDPQPADHSWEDTAVTADATGASLDHPHDANWVDICPFW